MNYSIVITCEHAGNQIPEGFEFLFEGAADVLQSHRGWDPGAIQVAEFLSEHLQCPLFTFHDTRLLIEPNRSIHSHQLFSEFSDKLDRQTKQFLIESLYFSYRDAVETFLTECRKPVVHLSIHSFTPIWNERPRKTDVGVLFDPARQFESGFCEIYRANLERSLSDFTIDFNEPYKGTDDGFTTYLRTRFDDLTYAGIEIEINQKFIKRPEMSSIQSALLKSLP
jgi:predicted N-formylglutamate amidohydrolase